jgi:hypothetical protein
VGSDRFAAIHAGRRDSFDQDHVLLDLVDRYETVLEAGLRQMRRTRPLETFVLDVGNDWTVVAPTAPEVFRMKAYLVVQRNVVRDYLDVVALADHLGHDAAVEILSDIDTYYTDRSGEWGSVLTSLVVALADPQPFDADVIEELPRYKRLDPRYHDWGVVVAKCQSLSLSLSGAA